MFFSVENKETVSAPCLSLWERCLSEAKTEGVHKAARPSQSPAVTALPEGEPRACTCMLAQKWSVSVSIRSIHCFTTAHQTPGRCFILNSN